MQFIKKVLTMFVEILVSIIDALFPEPTRFVFNRVRVGGLICIGEIKKVKVELGQNIEINSTPVGGNYEVGTAVHTVQAADANGNDISSEFSVEVQPDNELHVKIIRARVEGVPETECTGLVTLRADGDEDPGEEAPVTGTLDFSYDAPNATSFEMTGTAIPA